MLGWPAAVFLSIVPELVIEQIDERCCALDVHQATVGAGVRGPDRSGKRCELKARFVTVASELLALGGWLQELGVSDVAIEASGVYWKPVWSLLDEELIERLSDETGEPIAPFERQLEQLQTITGVGRRAADLHACRAGR
jgi:hypothetical protein